MTIVVRIGLKLARLRLAELALAREHDRRKVRERRGPGGRRHLEPGLYVCDDLRTRASSPGSIGAGNRSQEVTVESVIGALGREIIVDRSLRQAQQRTDHRVDGARRAHSPHCLGFSGAGLEIFDRAGLAETPTETLDIAHQLLVSV